ncbi:MAG: hypothetical protein AAGC60_05215 [Acidobacteriota bacterium]
MRKPAFVLVLVAVGLVGLGVSATLQTQLAGIVTAEVAPEPVGAESLRLGTAAFPFPGPRVCGDPCSPDGAQFGCIDQSSDPWRRVICLCSNGYLVC